MPVIINGLSVIIREYFILPSVGYIHISTLYKFLVIIYKFVQNILYKKGKLKYFTNFNSRYVTHTCECGFVFL